MKKKEDSKEPKWSDEILADIFNKGKAWFRPLIVEDKKGKSVDLHEGNLFINEYLMSKGLYRNAITEISQTRPWILDMYDELSEVQEFKLAKLGLLRNLDSSMVKFALSNKHDWKEKSQNTDTVTVKNIDLKELVSFTGGDKKK